MNCQISKVQMKIQRSQCQMSRSPKQSATKQVNNSKTASLQNIINYINKSKFHFQHVKHQIFKFLDFQSI